MSDAPQIKVSLTAEDTGVAAAIKALGDRLAELRQQQKQTADSALDLKGVFDKLISAEIVYKIVEFGKEVFNATVNVERMSQRTGLSAGLLSTMGKAAEASGVSTEQTNVAVTRLATSVTKFQQGATGAAAAFKTLNLTQSDFKNLSPDEKMKLVIDRLGGMDAGFRKTATATALLGRGGAVLLPTLQALAGDGFDKVKEAAIASGQYLSDNMAADAAAAAAAFAELEGAGKGIATQFEAGLLPALTDVADALRSDVEESGTSSFKNLGENAGKVVKTLVLAWTIGANTIGAILLSLYDVIKGQIDQAGNAIKSIAEAALDASQGRFKDAGKAIGDGFDKGVTLAKGSISDLQSRWTALADTVTKTSNNLFPTDDVAAARQRDREAKFKGNQGPESDGDAEDAKAEKAKLSLIQARLQAELALSKAWNAEQESENQIAYDRGLESLRAYFANKKALAEADSNEQISILQRERNAIASAPTDGTDAAAIAKKTALAKKDSDIAVARVTATTKQGQLDQQLFVAEESHQKTLLGYQAQILEAQGLTYEAALVKIQGEEAEIRRSLAQSGLSPAAIDELVGKLQRLKAAAAAFTEDKKVGEEALNSLADERDSINLKVTAGLDTQYGAEQKIATLELQRVPELQKIAAAMRAAAVTPDQVREADQFAQKVKTIQVNATAAANQMQQFGKQAGTAIQQDLNTFLTSTILSAKGVGDAFRQLAQSVVGSIQKIVAQLLIQIITQKIVKALTKQEDGPQGIATAGAKGIAQAAPLITAAGAMTASGITIGVGATALGVSAGALQIAADTLLLANSTGGGGFAAGGPVSGPGSGTSDSIPARLSDGEFVVRAAAVQAVGVNTLHAINRGMRVPAINGMSIPRFADGGLVKTGSGSNGVDLNIGVDMAEGLVLKHLSSKAAGKIVVSHVGSNPKAVQKAIQRGS